MEQPSTSSAVATVVELPPINKQNASISQLDGEKAADAVNDDADAIPPPLSQEDYTGDTINSTEDEHNEVGPNYDHALELSVMTWDAITKNDAPVPPSVALRVMDHATMVLERRMGEARPETLDIFRFETSVPKFHHAEILLDRRLAWGNFCDVYLIKDFRSMGDDLPSVATIKGCTLDQHIGADQIINEYIHEKEQRKKFPPPSTFETRRPSTTSDEKQYVIKVLRPNILKDPAMHIVAAADIVTEGTILGALDHPHILSLKGRSIFSAEGFATGKRDAFFLVFEKLRGNLSVRMREWQHQSKQGGFVLQRQREDRTRMLQERLETAIELASAMQYLHECCIIHRDLKLGNVGIDMEGRVKLLDFGLAKVLPKNAYKETFHLTKCTGSIRYIAPEVAKGETYNLKADVYSYAIVLYEILSMTKVWDGWAVETILEKVHHRKTRPVVSVFWPKGLRELLRSIWADLAVARLPMHAVHTILEDEQRKLVQG